MKKKEGRSTGARAVGAGLKNLPGNGRRECRNDYDTVTKGKRRIWAMEENTHCISCHNSNIQPMSTQGSPLQLHIQVIVNWWDGCWRKSHSGPAEPGRVEVM